MMIENGKLRTTERVSVGQRLTVEGSDVVVKRIISDRYGVIIADIDTIKAATVAATKAAGVASTGVSPILKYKLVQVDEYYKNKRWEHLETTTIKVVKETDLDGLLGYTEALVESARLDGHEGDPNMADLGHESIYVYFQKIKLEEDPTLSGDLVELPTRDLYAKRNTPDESKRREVFFE